ncbi:hypothetical protein M758_UG336600 [Ceratodon purpureus]|nr:hypothetical protein M758_UG336600 [Ceratodon purpureus]
MPVKISKRVGKFVWKYVKKENFFSDTTRSAEGTVPFVGEVTAMIDKITQGQVEENLPGQMGSHNPVDFNMSRADVDPPTRPHVDERKHNIEKGGPGMLSAGSGNKGG